MVGFALQLRSCHAGTGAHSSTPFLTHYLPLTQPLSGTATENKATSEVKRPTLVVTIFSDT